MENDDEYLQHYGVKGMQWGVRRSAKQLAKAAGKRKLSPEEAKVVAARKSAKSNRRVLDDADLDRFISRLEKEKKLKNLIEDDLTPGQKAAKMLLSDVGKRTISTALAGAGSYAAYKAAGKVDSEKVQMAFQAFFRPKKK